MISVDAARTHILNQLGRTPTQRIALSSAVGRVLAETVLAPTDFPQHDLSAMDGFAVRSADILPGTTLSLVGESAAGRPYGDAMPPNGCVRISTGAVLPEGADAVVMQEHCTQNDGQVTFHHTAAPGAHIRRRGSHLASSEVVYTCGTRLEACDIGVLASLNLPWVEVFIQPRVTILSNGDELVDLGHTPGPNQIVNSNAQMLEALVHQFGGQATVWPVVRDAFGDVARALELAAATSDLVLTVGGASVGDHDHIATAFKKVAGKELEFWKVAMKPGKPLVFGIAHNGTPMLGLPGNPISAFVCFHQFVRPALFKLQGHDDARPTLRVPTRHAIRSSAGRQEFVPGQLQSHEGAWVFVGPEKLDSGSPAQMRQIRALAVIPADVVDVPAQTDVDVQLL